MKYFIAVAFAAALLASTAKADETVQINSVPDGAIIYSSPVMINSAPVARSSRAYTAPRHHARQQTIIGRWIELERRKNAWLRQRFLGR